MASCPTAATLVHNPAQSTVVVRATARASPLNVGHGSAAFCSGLRKVDGTTRVGMKRLTSGDDYSSNVLLAPVAATGNSGSSGNLMVDSRPAEDAIPYTPTSGSQDSVSVFSLSLSTTRSASTKAPASTQQRVPAAIGDDQQPYLRNARPLTATNTRQSHPIPDGTLPARGQALKVQARQPVPVQVSQNGSARTIPPQQVTTRPQSSQVNTMSNGVPSNGVFWKYAAEAVEREKESAQAEAAMARAAAAATADRSQFLMRQFGALKEREAVAKEAVKQANGKVKATERQMEKMKQTQAQEVALLQATVAELKGQVQSLKSELVTADSATIIAKEKAAFLMRQLERVKATSVPAPSARQQAAKAKAAMDALRQRVAHLESQDAAAKALLKQAEQKLVLLAAELAASQTKESKAEAALTSTRSEVKALQDKLTALQEELRKGVLAGIDAVVPV